MDMERMNNTALAIAAEFRPAGHESWIVDDAEEANDAGRLLKRQTVMQSCFVMYISTLKKVLRSHFS